MVALPLLVAVAAGEPMLGPAGLLGLLAAAISHAARRVLAPLPATAMPRAQLAVAAASSLLVGVVAYVVVRYFVAWSSASPSCRLHGTELWCRRFGRSCR